MDKKVKCPVCKSDMEVKDDKYKCGWCNIILDPKKVTFIEGK